MSFEHPHPPPQSRKSLGELAVMRENARLLQALFEELHPYMQAGSTGIRVQEFCRGFFERYGLQTLLRGYRGFPADICISVNEVAVHGIPDLRPFAPGDVVSVDLAGRRKRFCADAAWSWVVAPASPIHQELIAAAWQCCTAGLAAGGRQRRISAIGRAIQQKSQALAVAHLPRFGGHGLGRHLHEAPVFAFVDAPQGEDSLDAGMVVNIEPVICQADCEASLNPDQWSWACPPGIRSAQFEMSLALLPDGSSEVLNFSNQAWLLEKQAPFF